MRRSCADTAGWPEARDAQEASEVAPIHQGLPFCAMVLSTSMFSGRGSRLGPYRVHWHTSAASDSFRASDSMDHDDHDSLLMVIG